MYAHPIPTGSHIEADFFESISFQDTRITDDFRNEMVPLIINISD